MGPLHPLLVTLSEMSQVGSQGMSSAKGRPCPFRKRWSGPPDTRRGHVRGPVAAHGSGMRIKPRVSGGVAEVDLPFESAGKTAAGPQNDLVGLRHSIGSVGLYVILVWQDEEDIDDAAHTTLDALDNTGGWCDAPYRTR